MNEEEIRKAMLHLDHLFYITLKPGKDQLDFNIDKLDKILINIIERMHSLTIMLLEGCGPNDVGVSRLESIKRVLSEAEKGKIRVHYDKAKPKREQEIISESGNALMRISDLEEFYYFLLPTRLIAFAEEPYSDERATSAGVSFPVRASGIYDSTAKHVDVWKRQHNLAWAHVDELSTEFLKQDSITHETYETISSGASGYPKGFTFYQNKLFWIGYISPSGYFLNISNPRPSPAGEYIDSLAVFDISNLISSGIPPSGIDIDEEGHIWILDENRQTLYTLDTMHDYFLVDKESRYIYFKEDYSDPGVFVKPA